ncbi:hypothetical protein D3C87_988090 [compost metagenome]
MEVTTKLSGPLPSTLVKIVTSISEDNVETFSVSVGSIGATLAANAKLWAEIAETAKSLGASKICAYICLLETTLNNDNYDSDSEAE